jgi:hypothetical protein
VDGSARAAVVARQVAAHPDWSPDARSLVCFRSDNCASSGDLRLGTLGRMNVFDAQGKLAADEKSTDLAGLIFHEENRVRCLRDGRVLFNAAEFQLPIAAKDTATRDEFFLAGADQSAVTRLFPRSRLDALPKSLGRFELSPDEKQILVSDDNGKVWLLTIASQRVEEVTEGFGKEDSVAPAWRAPGEFTYRKKIAARAELVQRQGAAETILSRSWPDEVLEKLVK